MESHYKIEDKHFSISLSGSFVFQDNAAFREILKRINENHEKLDLVIVDLGTLDYIDSSGLGMLLLLRESCEKLVLPLEIHHPQGQVKRIFELSKIDSLIKLKP